MSSGGSCGCSTWTNTQCTYTSEYANGLSDAQVITEVGLTEAECLAKSCSATFHDTRCTSDTKIGPRGMTEAKCAAASGYCRHVAGSCSSGSATTAQDCAELPGKCTFSGIKNKGGGCFGLKVGSPLLTYKVAVAGADAAAKKTECETKKGGCHWATGQCGLPAARNSVTHPYQTLADPTQSTISLIDTTAGTCKAPSTPAAAITPCTWTGAGTEKPSICDSGRAGLTGAQCDAEMNCNTWSESTCTKKMKADGVTFVTATTPTGTSNQEACEVAATCTFTKATCTRTVTSPATPADGPTKDECMYSDVTTKAKFETAQCDAAHSQSVCGDGTIGGTKAACDAKVCHKYTAAVCSKASLTTKSTCLKDASCTKKFWAAIPAAAATCSAGTASTQQACVATDCPTSTTPTCTTPSMGAAALRTGQIGRAHV